VGSDDLQDAIESVQGSTSSADFDKEAVENADRHLRFNLVRMRGVDQSFALALCILVTILQYVLHISFKP
jgi:hypothetical protein